jgi:hypothetical protein
LLNPIFWIENPIQIQSQSNSFLGKIQSKQILESFIFQREISLSTHNSHPNIYRTIMDQISLAFLVEVMHHENMNFLDLENWIVNHNQIH